MVIVFRRRIKFITETEFICVQYLHAIYINMYRKYTIQHIHAMTPHLFLFGGVRDYIRDTIVAKILQLQYINVAIVAMAA